MSKAEAKTIRLLNDGDLDGIIRMQDSKWNPEKAVKQNYYSPIVDRDNALLLGTYDIPKSFMNKNCAIALRQLPLGTAYAMWTGMGILGTTLLGVFLFMKNCRFHRSFVLFLL